MCQGIERKERGKEARANEGETKGPSVFQKFGPRPTPPLTRVCAALGNKMAHITHFPALTSFKCFHLCLFIGTS